MSTSEKDGGIPEYSADYRQAKPARTAGRRAAAPNAGPKSTENRETSVPGQSEITPAQTKISAGAGKAPSRQNKPSVFSGPHGGPKPAMPVPAGAGQRPSRQNQLSNSSAPRGGPNRTVSASGDTPSADDFLPADRADGGQMLTKWSEDASAAPVPSRPKKRGKYHYGILVGAVVMIFALIGVAFVATSIGTAIHAKLTDDSRLRAYDKFLTVVVAQDPKPFASPDKADPDFVLNASLWQTMTAEGANYTSYDDAGRTVVPLGDVADACRDLFGPDCELQPKNPTQETFFEYDAAKAQFHVALYSLDSTYVPYTQSAARDGDSTVLRVGYIPPSDPTRAQSSAVSSAAPTPAKVMEYVLKTDPSDQKEYIYAVRVAG